MPSWSETLTSAAAHFLEHGFCVVPGIVSKLEIARLRAICSEYYERTGEQEMFATHFLSVPELAGVPFRAEVLDVAHSVLGPGYTIFPNFTVRVSKYREWHVDRGFVADRECLRGPFRCMQMAVQLQDNHPEWGGGMDVAPASQHAPRRDGAAAPDHPVTIAACAGDLVCWDGRLRHRGTPAAAQPPEPKVVLYWSMSQSLPEHVRAFLDHLRSREFASSNGQQVRVARYADIQDVRYPESFSQPVLQLVAQQGLQVATIPARAAGAT